MTKKQYLRNALAILDRDRQNVIEGDSVTQKQKMLYRKANGVHDIIS